MDHKYGPTTCIGSESTDVVFLQPGREWRENVLPKRASTTLVRLSLVKREGLRDSGYTNMPLIYENSLMLI